MKQVAVIGGSFNPPTLQHALCGLEILRVRPMIDEVWYLPSNHHPHADRHAHKTDRPPFLVRYGWLEKMVIDMMATGPRDKKVRVCGIEKDIEGPCYTKVVLEHLYRIAPDVQFHWVIGSDCLQDLHTWGHIDWLRENARFLVYPRPGVLDDSLDHNVVSANHPNLDLINTADVIVSNISSTYARSNPEAAKWALTPSVFKAWAEYIE